MFSRWRPPIGFGLSALIPPTLRWKLPAAQRQRIQMVLLRESGTTQPAIAAAMGVSLSTVNRAHMAYDECRSSSRKPSPGRCSIR
jgi:predicted ArsR family transcriptional regulator